MSRTAPAQEKIRPAEGGFSLIEVLLALALLSVVLTALYTSFFMAQKAVTGSEDALLKLHETRTAMDMLRREAEAAIQGENTPFVVRDRDVYGRQASELYFTTNASPLEGPGRVSYYVREEEDRLVLIKRLASVAAPEDEGMEAEALEAVESFTVEAFDGRTWVKTWQGPGLPRELRITIAVPLKDRLLELSEAVRPREGKQL